MNAGGVKELDAAVDELGDELLRDASWGMREMRISTTPER
jgi:hypothetical protein